MTTLGRVYLAKGEHDSAIQWFDAALSRNNEHPDASYFKAITLAQRTPSDYPGAITAARAARTNGYVGADQLLSDLQEKARTG